MKKTLIATLLGLAVSAATSFGQGYIVVANYFTDGVNNNYSGVTYGANVPGHAQGTFVGSQFKADLLFSIGGGPFTLAAGSQANFWATGVDGGNPLVDGAGTFVGPTATIPGYVSGPVQFQVRAFNGADYASSTIFGTSAIFTINALQTNPLLNAGDLINGLAGGGLQPFSVTVVPEPSTFALAGLGSAALLIFRRRKM